MLFSSCTESFFYELARTNELPFTAKPVIKSFEIENAIKLVWSPDEGCDEFFLYRDSSPIGSFSRLIYRGTNLFFIDYDVVNENFYYYKLGKRRDDKISWLSDYIMGVCSDTKKDKYEENNNCETSAGFKNKTLANIYLYKNETVYGDILEDRDWYYVKLPARSHMIINFIKIENLLDGDLSLHVIEGITEESVIFERDYDLYNYLYEDQIIYFWVSPNRSRFISGDPSAVGGKIGTYRIDFEGLVNIQD